MIELGVVGARNSGKTTLMVELVQRLTGAGLRVATTKHTSHRHGFDTRGKDSYRHRKAGAGLTMAVSGNEVGIFADPACIPTEKLRELLAIQFDVWLVEGDKRAERPKILITRGLAGLRDGVPHNVSATIGPHPVEGVPVHFDSENIAGLADFVMGIENYSRPEEYDHTPA